MTDTLLFACGTLTLEKVHVALFGRVLDYEEDALPGYTARTVLLEDQEILSTTGSATHLSMVPSDAPGAAVQGRVMHLTEAELTRMDPHQSEHHRRTRVTLASGREAWAYLGG
ncbi:MAG: gamma-glutamylcyclotransferase [Sphingomonadales bacterium]|nr:MAG: gamma-glutamylcyclotransferase [Sphingomonadales bacterium]